jgi:hypothetical protein
MLAALSAVKSPERGVRGIDWDVVGGRRRSRAVDSGRRRHLHLVENDPFRGLRARGGSFASVSGAKDPQRSVAGRFGTFSERMRGRAIPASGR